MVDNPSALPTDDADDPVSRPSAENAQNPPASMKSKKLTFQPPAPGRILAAVVGFALWCLGIWLVVMARINAGNNTAAIVVAIVMAVIGTAACWWGMRRRQVGLAIRGSEIEYFSGGRRLRIDCRELTVAGCVVERIDDRYPNGPSALWIGVESEELQSDSAVVPTPAEWDVPYRYVLAVPLTSDTYNEAQRKAQVVADHFEPLLPDRWNPTQVLSRTDVRPHTG